MKPEVMLELLENAAEQLAIRISYETLASALVGQNGMRGGLCKVKGPDGMTWRVIIDKRATAEEKLTTLATALATFDTTELELAQKVRDLLRTHEGSGKHRRTAA
jgi:hypothetical protein